jgi:hypothetical protein
MQDPPLYVLHSSAPQLWQLMAEMVELGVWDG